MTEIVKPRTLSNLGGRHEGMCVNTHARRYPRKVSCLVAGQDRTAHIMRKNNSLYQLTRKTTLFAHMVFIWRYLACLAFQQVHLCRILLNLTSKLPELATSQHQTLHVASRPSMPPWNWVAEPGSGPITCLLYIVATIIMHEIFVLLGFVAGMMLVYQIGILSTTRIFQVHSIAWRTAPPSNSSVSLTRGADSTKRSKESRTSPGWQGHNMDAKN